MKANLKVLYQLRALPRCWHLPRWRNKSALRKLLVVPSDTRVRRALGVNEVAATRCLPRLCRTA